jgi:peptide/nickel transport system permease protein
MKGPGDKMLHIIREFRKDRLAILGTVILFLLTCIALLAPYIAPFDPVELNLAERLLSPSARHLMGTDSVGRDILSRTIYGTRVSLMIAVVVVTIEVLFGVVVGTAAGYLGRAVDEILMRLVDILLAFPGIILALVIVGLLGSSMVNLIIALTCVGWVRYARIVRGSILSIKKETFIESARAIGCGKLRIAIRHILPNIISPVIVLATLNMGTIIISIAGLSFLGLGVQPPTPEWGIMLSEGKPFMESAPHLMIFPGLMIMVTVLAFNFLGDGLRDVLDSKIKGITEY